MDEYLKAMENYSPNSSPATGKSLDESKIIEFGGVSQTVTSVEEEKHEDVSYYMTPRTIEVKRYRLKK